MNKKILYTVLAAGLVLPMAVANAGVKVYGAAQVELSAYSDESGATGVDTGGAGLAISKSGPDDTMKQDDNARGRVGVKASEDLGGGMKGLAQFEWKADTTDNDTGSKVSLAPRVSLVGLKGGFGTVMLGNLKSPYKYTGGVKYDAFVTTALEARGNGGMTGKTGLASGYGHNGFVQKVIGYSSPKVNGLQFMLTFRLDEGGLDAAVPPASNEKDGGYILSVKYANGPIEAFVAALDDDETQGGGTSYSAVKLGGKYKTGAIAIMGQYEIVTNTADLEETVIFLAGHYKMGKNTIVLQFGNNDVEQAAGATDTDAMTYLAVGLIHKFSKKARVFVGYRSSSDAENVFSVGMRKDFSS